MPAFSQLTPVRQLQPPPYRDNVLTTYVHRTSTAVCTRKDKPLHNLKLIEWLSHLLNTHVMAKLSRITSAETADKTENGRQTAASLQKWHYTHRYSGNISDGDIYFRQ